MQNLTMNIHSSRVIKKQNIYHLHNVYGLGDSVFNMILFIIIQNFIIQNNIKIFYYTKGEYLTQLQEFINDNTNIMLYSLDKKPPHSIELWINNDYFKYTHDNVLKQSKTGKYNYNIFYEKFFNIVLRKLNFKISINKLVYYDNNLLNRYNVISNKYKNFDILILNTNPFSGQYNYDKNTWDNYILKLNSCFKILTTTKVEGVLCTYDDKLTIKDIASLSTHAKIVIAINSGVFPGLLNYYTLTKVRQFYIFDCRCFYSYPNFQNNGNNKNICDITFEELKKYLN